MFEIFKTIVGTIGLFIYSIKLKVFSSGDNTNNNLYILDNTNSTENTEQTTT